MFFDAIEFGHSTAAMTGPRKVGPGKGSVGQALVDRFGDLVGEAVMYNGEIVWLQDKPRGSSMVYRGRVTAGVVVIEGDPPSDGTLVEVVPLEEPSTDLQSLASHPAAGIWKDRTDLPSDSSEAKRQLGRHLMGFADE